ncbi:hypothetical protein H9P43_000605 [Blastocladiella emersonii ATCC 22665]|nr:hypothetical protein H9P43_000605 [Blastocladiella emersonii ATCC 22665]
MDCFTRNIVLPVAATRRNGLGGHGDDGLLSIGVVESRSLEAAVAYSGNVWPAALALALAVCAQAETLAQGRVVVELGAGTCLPSLVAAQLGARYVLATDRTHGAMPPVAAMARANPGLPAGVLATAPMPWGDAEAVESVLDALGGHVDVVLGADVLFHHDHYDRVLGTFHRLAAGSSTPPVLVIAHQRRSSSHTLTPLLAVWGLVVTRAQPASDLLAHYAAGEAGAVGTAWWDRVTAGDGDGDWQMAGMESVDLLWISRA